MEGLIHGKRRGSSKCAIEEFSSRPKGRVWGAVYWGKKGSTICVQTTDILDRIPRVWVMR